MRARSSIGAIAVAALTACTPGVTAMKDKPTLCTTVAACDAHDGTSVTVIGTYQRFPDQPGVDYSGVPRGARLALEDGPGPMLEPYWHKASVRSDAEVARFAGKKVRVTGRYHRVQPRNPDDPPYASAMGGSCLYPVEAIEPAE